MALSPNEFIKDIYGKPVMVKLNTGLIYKGRPLGVPWMEPSLILLRDAHHTLRSLGLLASLDGNMNIVLESATEFLHGEKKRTYPDAFIRGNNGRHGCPCPSGWAQIGRK